MEIPATANVRVVETGDRGRSLVAATDLHPGDLVLSEEPIVLVPRKVADDELCEELESVGEFAAAMWAVYFCCRDLDENTLCKLMRLHAPEDSQVAEGWRQILYPHEDAIREVLPDFDANFFLRVSLAFNFNSVACSLAHENGSSLVDDLGDAVYELTSCMNHSCLPNTSSRTLDVSGTTVVRAVCSIASGEEITACYMEPPLLLSPTAMRRERLMEAYEFICQCVRCAAYADDVLRFPCEQENCKGTFCVQPGKGARVAGDHARACSECKSVLHKDAVERLVANDADFAAQVFCMDFEECDTDAAEQVLKLRSVHPQHYLTYHIALLQERAYRQLQDSEGLLVAARLEEGCWNVLSGRPQRDWAFSLQKLGELLSSTQDDEASGSNGRLLEANATLQASLRMMTVVDGPQSPYVTQIAKKLANVQRLLSKQQLFDNAMSLTSVSCGFCGLEPREGTKLLKCSKCRQVAYCCVEHQRMQWPVHKTSCKTGGEQG